MSGRYNKLFDLPLDGSATESPVAFSAGALLSDVQTKKKIVQLKIKNCSEKAISKVCVAVYSKSETKQEKINTHVYANLSVEPNDEFGTQEPIVLCHSDVVSFRVVCTEVQFADGTSWKLATGDPYNNITILKYAKLAWLPLVITAAGILFYIIPALISAVLKFDGKLIGYMIYAILGQTPYYILWMMVPGFFWFLVATRQKQEVLKKAFLVIVILAGCHLLAVVIYSPITDKINKAIRGYFWDQDSNIMMLDGLRNMLGGCFGGFPLIGSIRNFGSGIENRIADAFEIFGSLCFIAKDVLSAVFLWKIKQEISDNG